MHNNTLLIDSAEKYCYMLEQTGTITLNRHSYRWGKRLREKYSHGNSSKKTVGHERVFIIISTPPPFQISDRTSLSIIIDYVGAASHWMHCMTVSGQNGAKQLVICYLRNDSTSRRVTCVWYTSPIFSTMTVLTVLAKRPLEIVTKCLAWRSYLLF